MGHHGLELLDTGDFKRWLVLSGFESEMDFWASLSGLSDGSLADHMEAYLTSLGYTGTIYDKFRQFLRSQSGIGETLHEMASSFYEGSWSPPGATVPLEDTDGVQLTDTDGTGLDIS